MTVPSTLTSKGLSWPWGTSTGSLVNSTWPARARELKDSPGRTRGLALALSVSSQCRSSKPSNNSDACESSEIGNNADAERRSKPNARSAFCAAQSGAAQRGAHCRGLRKFSNAPRSCGSSEPRQLRSTDGLLPHLIGELFGKVGLELAHRSVESGPAVCDVNLDHCVGATLVASVLRCSRLCRGLFGVSKNSQLTFSVYWRCQTVRLNLSLNGSKQF